MQLQRVTQAKTAETSRQRSAAAATRPPLTTFAPVHPILQLQQTIGNQAVQRLLRSRALQPKLSVSQPGDIYEQEADRVAEQVMHMPAPTVQRACVPCAAGGAPCPKCEAEKTQLLQRKTESAVESGEVSVPDNFLQSLGPGQPLDYATRAFFEPRFGQDFRDVRVHTGNQAAESARAINALAYAVGTDLVFGSGQYAPKTEPGQRLVAHELTHVVQQQRARQRIQRLTITQHAFTKGTCRERNVQWVFSLDKPAPEDGYIVQQIDESEFVATCPNEAIGPPAPIQTFWEAWFVKKGEKSEWLAAKMKYTDSNTFPPQPDTNGSEIDGGTIKFFKKSTTGDLGVDGKAPADPKSPWGPGKVPSSGALPSTPTKPSWWGTTPVEGPAEREMSAQWNCCGADKSKHINNITVKP